MTGFTRDELRPIVAEMLRGALTQGGQGGAGIIGSPEVLEARARGHLEIPAGAVVSPLAREAAERFGVELRRPAAAAAEADAGPSPFERGGPIAIGSDHGGFELKRALIARLEAWGLRAWDVGTHSKESCDYPDFALEVARRIALGEAPWGVVVDGAGIGSCMAANKVPGVLAANCHSAATARNSREHNGANVLCLGAGHLTEAEAAEVLRAWLETPFGGGRHGRRVDKIRAIEQSFVGGRG